VSWVAVLLALTVGAALPTPAGKRLGDYGPQIVIAHTHKAKKKHHHPPKAKVRPRATPAPVAAPRPGPTSGGSAPSATPTPVATPITPGATATPAPTATAVPTPTATPVLHTRSGVSLADAPDDMFSLRSTYHDFAHGSIEFVANNTSMDDHDLTVREGGKDVGTLFVPSRESDSLVLSLDPGTYTLYCSIADHEQLGMRYDITVW
jgi:hypothetical protein